MFGSVLWIISIFLACLRGEAWFVRGKILEGASAERGHYEAGLYLAVGRNGLPIGYPVVQAILPEGITRFRLKVSREIKSGFLFARFVEHSGERRSWIVPTFNPWFPGKRGEASLFLRVRDLGNDGVRAENGGGISGKTVSLFGKGRLPVGDVRVRFRGMSEFVKTDANGFFKMRQPDLKGLLFMDFEKEGFYRTSIPFSPPAIGSMQVELASMTMIDQLAAGLGVSQVSSKGIFIGKILSEAGSPLKGAMARISGKADGPFYFDETGNAKRELERTGSDGRFLFLNVEPGAFFFECESGGEAALPVRTFVRSGELQQKKFQFASGLIHGKAWMVRGRERVLPLAQGLIRVEGGTEWTRTDSLGYFQFGPLRFLKDEPVYLGFSAPGIRPHRYRVHPGKMEHHLFAIPDSTFRHLGRLSDESFDESHGLALGRISGTSLHLELVPDNRMNAGDKDFYFDAQGKIRRIPSFTDSRFGTYLIRERSEGHFQLLGTEKNGQIRYGSELYLSPGVVTVEVDDSMP